MADPAALLEKHRSKGVLLDANLLVLYLIGRVNPERIAKFKRTQGYTADDFEVLRGVVAWCGGLAATPHVLSQASDLATPTGSELGRVRREFRSLAQGLAEGFESSQVLTVHPLFERLGLADAAIASACERGLLVLTDDIDLQIAIEVCGGDALNFGHLREMAWERVESLWRTARE